MKEATETDTSTARGLLWVAAGWLMLVVVRNAWLSDDAYITLRSVDNLIEGRGITWNPGQRLQAFTHPLWFWVLSAVYALTHETYYTAVFVSLALAAFSVVALMRAVPRDTTAGVLVLLALSCSKSFVDFSTSGLENVLTQLLLVPWLLALLGLKRGEAQGSHRVDMLTGLLVFNRLDTAFLIAPGYLWCVWTRFPPGHGMRPRLRALAWAGGPQLLWMLFSLGYFGLLLPNTAYAKLNVSLPLDERLAQGAFYVLSLTTDDPVTALLLLLGFGLGLRQREPGLRAVCLGGLSHLAYLHWIGGDFMLGRFFSAPLILAAVVLLRLELGQRHALACYATLALCTLGTAAPPWVTGRPVGDAAHADAPLSRFRDVSDERRFYFPNTGLIRAVRGDRMPRGSWPEEGKRMAGTRGKTVYAAGIRGYFAGPKAWVIDKFALADPFLARLRVVPLVHWKSGHYPRELPEGYVETIEKRSNQLHDPRMRAVYDDIVLATQAPLLSTGRLDAIVRLHSGADELPVINYR